MKALASVLLLAMAMFVMSMQPSQAQSSMSSSSSMMMPKCASGDSVVGVNMTTKMYMTCLK